MKRIIVFTICLYFTLLLKGQSAIPFAGSGTPQDPYLIGSLAELRFLTENKNLWNSVFVQTADIDASESRNWNNGAGMKSIGDGTIIFTGSYDGQGHIIEGIYMNRPAVNFAGLFGYTENAVIKNIGVIDVDITGNNAVGGLIALNQSLVSNCFSTGKVQGALNVGGFSGRNDQNSKTVNCYSRCDVNGTRQVGGFVGFNNGYSSVSNCYSTGLISGSGAFFGGFAGLNSSQNKILNSFWNIETSGKINSDGGKGLKTVEMNDRLTFTDKGWDFQGEQLNGNDEIWNIGNSRNDNYPYLSWQYPDDKTTSYLNISEITDIKTTNAITGGMVIYNGGSDIIESGVCWSTNTYPLTSGMHTSDLLAEGTFTSLISGLKNNTTYYVRAYAVNESGTSYSMQDTFTTAVLDGAGTIEDPHTISTLEDLKAFSEDTVFWNKQIVQTEDIDASETRDWNDGEGWLPVGNVTVQFSGTYDGGGHTVSGLFISRPDDDYQGFFGYTRKAIIKNLGLENFDIQGLNNVGGITGFNESDVSTCFCTGRVRGYNNVGLLLGMNYNNSSVRNCYSIGDVEGNVQVGSLIGSNFSKTITENCYSTGSVKGVNSVGGLIGNNTSNLICSYFDTEVTGQVTSKVGVEKSKEEMLERQTYTDNGWDFKGESINGESDIWNIANNRNGGYPYFNWQFPDDPALAYISTSEVTDITKSSASAGGVIVSDGGSDIVETGLCFSIENMPDINDSLVKGVITDSIFNLEITGLNRNTKYYYRSYAINEAGISYGKTLNFTTLILDGKGLETDPYLISDLGDLKALSENSFLWDKWFLQKNDIDASETAGWNEGRGWSPIGNSTLKFSGIYEGAGHIIYSLYINRPEESYVGFFGWTNNSVIRNIGLTNFNISGSYGVGGLVGNNYNSAISFCFTKGILNASSNAGGLAGRNYNSVIENCYSKAETKGTDCIGGLAGNNLKEAVIRYCYSSGKVSGATNTGGLTGANSAEVISSLWDKEISAQKYSSGGTGLTTTQMKYRPEYIESGWDFKGEDANGVNEYWNMSSRINGSYPFLNWEYPLEEVAGLPEIITSDTSEVTKESAVLGGEIINDGGAEIIERGICWGEEIMPSLSDSVEYSQEDENIFSFLINVLKDSTTYYYRAFAKNLAGLAYGDVLSFTTKKIETDTVGVAEIFNTGHLRVFSTDNHLVINGTRLYGSIVQINDINGRVISRCKIDNDTFLQVPFAGKGLYLVSILRKQGVVSTMKIHID